MRGGEAVPDALHHVVHVGLGRIHHLHGASVLAPREGSQHGADLAEPFGQEVIPRMCQVPYGLVSGGMELPHRCGTDVDHLRCRHRPCEIPVVVPRNSDDSVTRICVAAKLGEHLVPGNADRDREPELGFHSLRYLPRHEHGIASEQRKRSSHIDPRLVQAEGLNPIRVIVVDHARELRVPLVRRVVRRHNNEIGAFLPRLPYGLGCLHASSLGLVRLREYDAVSLFRVACDRDRLAAQRRIEVLRNRRIEGVHVYVHDDAIAHGTSLQREHLFDYGLDNDASRSRFRQSNKLWFSSKRLLWQLISQEAVRQW